MMLLGISVQVRCRALLPANLWVSTGLNSILSLLGDGKNSSQLNDLQEVGLETKKTHFLLDYLQFSDKDFRSRSDQENDITFFACQFYYRESQA